MARSDDNRRPRPTLATPATGRDAPVQEAVAARHFEAERSTVVGEIHRPIEILRGGEA